MAKDLKVGERVCVKQNGKRIFSGVIEDKSMITGDVFVSHKRKYMWATQEQCRRLRPKKKRVARSVFIWTKDGDVSEDCWLLAWGSKEAALGERSSCRADYPDLTEFREVLEGEK